MLTLVEVNDYYELRDPKNRFVGTINLRGNGAYLLSMKKGILPFPLILQGLEACEYVAYGFWLSWSLL